MNYDFLIAGIQVRFEIPYPLRISGESQAFLSEFRDAPDLCFRVCLTEEPIRMPAESGTWQIDSCYYQDDMGYTVYHCPLRGKPPYARVCWQKSEPKLLSCTLDSAMATRMTLSSSYLNVFGLEQVLLQFQGLLLHASFIRWNGRGILFSAPSGTGKSTQAELWRKIEGAEIINGDRACIRKWNDIWEAWGLPYAGSSGVYRNDHAPIAALVILRQARENRIRRIPLSDALRYSYPELSIHHWDPEYVDQVVSLFLEAFSQIPVYLLECLPDSGAVRTLKDVLENGGVST